MDEAPYTQDLNLSAVTSREELCAKLRTVRIRADKPSLRQLEIRTRYEKRPLTKNIAAQILNGNRFPGREEMLSFLRACGIQADFEPWLRAWERIAETEVTVTKVIDRLQLRGDLDELQAGNEIEVGDAEDYRKIREELELLRREQRRMSAAISSMQAYLSKQGASPMVVRSPAPAEGAQGKVVNGRYRLTECLSPGGMGSVWRGQDELLDRLVALKSLAPYYARYDSGDLLARMVREARAMARVEHPAIIPIYDIIFDNDAPWIVMKYVDGRQLTSLLSAEGPLSDLEAARIGLPIALGLSAVHAAGVVHRDIKPANILVTDDRSVFLADLGISTTSEGDRLTGPELLVGTMEFMAPERIEDRPDGPPSDIWSLGVTFYKMCTGTSPFLRSSASAAAFAILTKDVPPLDSDHLGKLVGRMLRKDPDARPVAREVADTLRDILADSVV